MAVTQDMNAKDGWVRAIEDLPVEGDERSSDDVLVVLDDDTMTVAYYDYQSRNWCDRWGFEMSEKVTFWRLLPELPNE